MVKTIDYIRRYMPLSAVIDTLRRRTLSLLDPQNCDDRNDRRFMQLYKEKKGYSSLYAMCGSCCTETYNHWRIYTPASEGACLELHRKPLESILETSNSADFGEVDYLSLDRVRRLGPNDLERLPFSKRAGYGAEEEYRVIAWSDEPQAPAMGIDICLSMVKRVELNPWMPRSLAASMRDTLRAIAGCEHLKTSQSSLVDNEEWREAGDRVVGREPSGPTTPLPVK
jgi:hypothetical protein